MRAFQTMTTARGSITIIHDAALVDVMAHAISPGLVGMIRSPVVRRQVLRNLAAAPEARLTVAVADATLIGHVAVAPSFGRWQTLPHVREIAFEVAREWRRLGVLTRLLDVALADPAVEDEIVLAFLWPSAWDLGHVGLQPTSYRRLLVALGEQRRFRTVATDEPEIAYGGALIARVGRRVTNPAVASFDQARYRHGAPRRAAA